MFGFKPPSILIIIYPLLIIPKPLHKCLAIELYQWLWIDPIYTSLWCRTSSVKVQELGVVTLIGQDSMEHLRRSRIYTVPCKALDSLFIWCFLAKGVSGELLWYIHCGVERSWSTLVQVMAWYLLGAKSLCRSIVELLLVSSLGTNSVAILIKIHKNVNRIEMSSAKYHPFCSDFLELK